MRPDVAIRSDHRFASITCVVQLVWGGLPEAVVVRRHTFASLLIDSGANAKAIQEFMGRSKIQTTFDIYGHLLPGSHDEVRERMDAYLAGAYAHTTSDSAGMKVA
jgi:hypothetical protein